MDLADPLTEAGTTLPPPPQWVVFRCQERHYALALGRAREVLTPRPFTRLPGAGGEAAGLIGVRSRVVTCFDLGTVLEGKPARLEPEHRIVLVDHEEAVLGLVVEAVLAVAALEGEGTGPAGEGVAGSEYRWEGKPVWALDTDALCRRLLLHAGP